MGFEGKIAIVTGSGQGIGKGIALKLAQKGANVAVVDLNLDTATAVSNEIKALGRKSIAVKVDVSSSALVNQMVQQVLKELGTIDILVNNAGYVTPAMTPFYKETEDYWNKVISICYTGMVYCCKAVSETMMAKKYGKIVSITSDASRVGQSGQAVYSGAKGAVASFSKAIAVELARYNINVNCVAPGCH